MHDGYPYRNQPNCTTLRYKELIKVLISAITHNIKQFSLVDIYPIEHILVDLRYPVYYTTYYKILCTHDELLRNDPVAMQSINN